MDHPTLLPTLLQIGHTARVCASTMVDATFGVSSRPAIDARLRSWSDAGARVTGMRLEVEGIEHVSPEATYVVMSNHQSNWDIIALYRAFPGRTLRMIAKQEMRSLPLLGRAMQDAEFIFVDRGDSARARDAIELARRKIEDGVNIWIAPEDGTRHVTPPGDLRVRRGAPVSVRFHPPIDPKAFGPERRDALVAAVRASIASGLPPELR